jgi:hypothetical protein
MKTRRKRYLAVCLVFLLLGMMFMPLGALAEGTEVPKGYVDPVSTLGMKRGDFNVFGEFWDRLEEIYLVPYEANVAHFDAFLYRAENKRFHPVSGPPLIIKRGTVIPEYRLDLSYGPVQYTIEKTTVTAKVSGEYVMKNIQFGTTEGKAIHHNVGGSYTVTDDFASTPNTISEDLVEAIDYGNQYRLPEASYAAAATIDADDPTTLRVRSEGKRRSRDGTVHQTVIVNFRVAGVKLSDKAVAAADKATGTVDTRADKDKGETGVSIPEALAIVIIGGAAAMAGAGAGGRSGDGGDNNSKRRSRYRMCLRKDFGDAIRYDTQPVTVYARIVEVTPEGEEIDRPDLTSAIETFSGGNLAVEDCSMAGNYMGALVSAKSVPGGENPGTGIVSIRFSGEEGSFQNNVTFRLIGKPYLSFPEQGSYLTMTLPMLLGDGKLYETPVTLHDFLEKPTSVRLDVAEGVPLSCELEEIEDIENIENMEAIEEAGVQSYILKVKNLSPKPEGLQTVKQTFGFGILAQNDKEKAENSLNAELYPEGLSIREVKFDDQGYVLIDTFDNEATDEWGDVVPTGFVLDFAVPEQDDEGRPTVRVLEPQEYSPVFAGLKGTEERTTHLAERFKYSIQEIPSNLKEYKFAPEEALVEEEGKPYFLTLPISCTYGQEEYTLDLKLRLLGGGPGPLAGWDEALAHMKKVVSKVGGISPELAKMLRENGKKMSTAELRLVTYRICHDAVIYYTRDAAEYEKIAAELDNMLYYAEWLKWFGDQAFSYLISKYYGNTADALLSPAKDVFAALLGEVLDYLLNDEQITVEELETIKNITAGVDNLIINAFDDATSNKNITFKQVCAVVAGFLVWKIAKNIYENRDKDGKIDLYSAITALTADLTAMGVKKIAGNFFDKALKNSAVQKALNKPISKWMQNIAPNVFKGRWDIDKQGEYLLKIVEFKQSDIIKKYLEETFGAGAVMVVEMGAEATQDSVKPTGDSNASPVDLSAWPRISWVSEFTDQNDQKTASLICIDLGFEAIGKFFDHLFGELFGEVPFATEAKSPPVDPPYLPK